LTCLLMSVKFRSPANAPGFSSAAPLDAGPLGRVAVSPAAVGSDDGDEGDAEPCFLPVSHAVTSNAHAASAAPARSHR